MRGDKLINVRTIDPNCINTNSMNNIYYVRFILYCLKIKAYALVKKESSISWSGLID